MKRAIILLFIALLLIPSVLMAAEGSCVFTKNDYRASGKYRVERIWVCTASGSTGNLGSASAATITGTGYDETIYSGGIKWVELVPATGGDAPTAVTTCKILGTADSTYDYAGGLFASASTSNTTAAMPLDAVNGGPVEVNGKVLTIQATGLGNSKKITVRMISER